MPKNKRWSNSTGSSRWPSNSIIIFITAASAAAEEDQLWRLLNQVCLSFFQEIVGKNSCKIICNTGWLDGCGWFFVTGILGGSSSLSQISNSSKSSKTEYMQNSEIQAKFAKTHYRQKSESWPKLTILRAYFFFFPLSPHRIESNNKAWKKTSPDHACAPLLTKISPKKPGKKNKWVWSMIPIPARKPKTDDNPFQITNWKTRTQQRNQKSNHNPFQITNGKTVHTRDHCWSCHRCRDSTTSQVPIATHLSLSPHGGWLQQQPYCFAFCALLACYSPSLVANTKLYKICASFSAVFWNFLLLWYSAHALAYPHTIHKLLTSTKTLQNKNKRAHAHTLLSRSLSLAQRTGHQLSPLVWY